MAEPKKVKARVLVNGVHGQVDDVVSVTEAELEANKGVLDASAGAVEYAEGLAKASTKSKK